MNDQPLFDRMPVIAQIGLLAFIILTTPVWGLAYLLEGITVSQTCNYATVSEAEKSHETWVRRFMRQEEQGGMGSPYVLIENPQLLVA